MDGINNLISLGFTAICIFVFINDDQNKDNLKQEILWLNRCFCAVVFIALTVSIFWFITNTHIEIISRGDYTINLGFFENRLFGVFSSPNVGGTYSALAIVAALINLFGLKKKVEKIETTFYIVVIILSIIYNALSNSRGTYVCCIAAIVIFFIFKPLQCKFVFLNSKITAIVTCMIAITLTVVCFISIIPFVRYTMSYVPYIVSNETSCESSANSVDLNRIETTRVDLNRIETTREDIDISNKRFDIWVASLKLLKTDYVWGFGGSTITEEQGTQYLADGILTQKDITYLNYADGNTHNGYLHILVKCGPISFVLFIIFLVMCIIKVLKARKIVYSNCIAAFAIAVVTYILINNLFETNILFLGANIFQAIFWAYAGYLLIYCGNSIKEVTE